MNGPRPAPAGWLDPLVELVGVERELSTLVTRLRDAVHTVRAPTVGAMQITCSDEAQRETLEVFQRSFVEYLLPSQSSAADKSPFRTNNLAGRYEWGSVSVAEDHFADTGAAWKVLVVLCSAHVAVSDGIDGASYGSMRRYGGPSAYCGALHRLFDDPPSTLPALRELGDDFRADGVDRVARLRDEVGDRTRYLMAAICHARLTARKAMLDVQDHRPASPTLYLVVPTVTINRPGHDHGLIVGAYVADHLTPERTETWVGLGDRPERYVLHETSQGALVEDAELVPRSARDHRAMILDGWRSAHRPPELDDPRLAEAVAAVAETGARGGGYSRPALATALGLLAETNPVTGALFMFGNGLIGMHRVADAQRLLREAADDDVARDMLAELMPAIDRLDPDQASHLARLLTEQFGPR